MIIDLGGVPGQNRIGFHYWKDGKAFKPYKKTGDLGKFLGFVNALVLALFAYIGTELIGVTVSYKIYEPDLSTDGHRSERPRIPERLFPPLSRRLSGESCSSTFWVFSSLAWSLILPRQFNSYRILENRVDEIGNCWPKPIARVPLGVLLLLLLWLLSNQQESRRFRRSSMLGQSGKTT